MSEYTKGKLELGCICDWELWIGADHHIADVHGNLPTRHANATELVRRWNSQPDLLEACKAIIENRAKPGNTQITQNEWDKLHAAIAKAEKE